ncbi:MAG: rhodanese-like domain-containing protein [Merismopediaceae bacterium]|nr:rhodanese-like domain-containing protein [Merismopediaceae bacterium]
MTKPVLEITVQELALRLKQAEPPLQLMDVREPHEVAIAHIEGFDILPLSDFTHWSEQILKKYDPKKETLVLCHHGMRSERMCQWLRNIGFTQVKNVIGGIDAYSREVDSNLPRY